MAPNTNIISYCSNHIDYIIFLQIGNSNAKSDSYKVLVDGNSLLLVFSRHTTEYVKQRFEWKGRHQ